MCAQTTFHIRFPRSGSLTPSEGQITGNTACPADSTPEQHVQPSDSWRHLSGTRRFPKKVSVLACVVADVIRAGKALGDRPDSLLSHEQYIQSPNCYLVTP